MGSNRLKAYQMSDYMEAYDILCNSKIASEIYEDGAERKFPDLLNEFWIGIASKEGIIGCYRVHKMGAVTWQGHAHILPQYRKKYSFDSTCTALQWCADRIPDLNKIITTVPACFPNVIHHLQSLDFEHEGTIKESYLRKGEIIDIEIYTISIQQIRTMKCLQQH